MARAASRPGETPLRDVCLTSTGRPRALLRIAERNGEWMPIEALRESDANLHALCSAPEPRKLGIRAQKPGVACNRAPTQRRLSGSGDAITLGPATTPTGSGSGDGVRGVRRARDRVLGSGEGDAIRDCSGAGDAIALGPATATRRGRRLGDGDSGPATDARERAARPAQAINRPESGALSGQSRSVPATTLAPRRPRRAAPARRPPARPRRSSLAARAYSEAARGYRRRASASSS